ncbi:MAG: hypothetical protein E7580_02240 [Ruminococcaceae bacterium]|nr:hypothetical protein [Oscillospiraceae bacterium]
MKRYISAVLCTLLLLTSCTGEKAAPDANSCAKYLEENESFFLECVAEMEKFGEDRIYVAMEADEKKKDSKARLVSYPKESEDRTEIENELLEKALTQYGFRLILFQTASDARRSVIFSYTKEKDDGIQNGIYYSYDSLPCPWWGRKAELTRRDGRWIQIDRAGNATYYTLKLSEHFYYFEKCGELIA